MAQDKHVRQKEGPPGWMFGEFWNLILEFISNLIQGISLSGNFEGNA